MHDATPRKLGLQYPGYPGTILRSFVRRATLQGDQHRRRKAPSLHWLLQPGIFSQRICLTGSVYPGTRVPWYPQRSKLIQVHVVIGSHGANYPGIELPSTGPSGFFMRFPIPSRYAYLKPWRCFRGGWVLPVCDGTSEPQCAVNLIPPSLSVL
eukprot:3805302-Rhodomonas_salina.1